jgi:hypothetical protein
MVKWTREHIIREILRREAARLPLNLGGEQPVDQALYQAGSRVFGSWRNAVMAAGIPPERAKAKGDWSPCRILATIRSLSRRRRALRPAELERRYGHLVDAARHHFGSWAKAAVAAGVDPAKLKRTPSWTRERIIEAILKRALTNEPLKSRAVRPRSLADAGTRVFGSWRSALLAAGVDVTRQTVASPGVADNTPMQPVPARGGLRRSDLGGQVLEAIQVRLRQRRMLNATSVLEDDSHLYWVAKGCYGSWRRALLAAGLNPDHFRRRIECAAVGR